LLATTPAIRRQKATQLSHWVRKPVPEPVPSQDKVGWFWQEGIQRKNGDEGGGSLINPDGVAPSLMFGVPASDIFSCIIKS